MTAGGWGRAKEIFNDALETPAVGRSAFVLQRSGGDLELARQVEDLLALHVNHGALALDQAPTVAVSDFMNGNTRGPSSQSRAGHVLAGRYRLGERLGGGGMGEVHRAIDLTTGQPLAIKTIRPFQADAGQAEGRFLREVRMAQKINHPNVCRMIALEEHDGERFCVMELVEGETLAARLARQGRLNAGEALPIALALCEGLTAAHEAGVVHRDLKPGNVLLAGGRVVIIDFGAAAGPAHERSLTADGDVIGTLAYMAPEQLDGGMASPVSDLYALGVVLYEMLTDQKPHAARSPVRLAAQKALEVTNTRRLGIPPVWSEVIERCLRRDPKKRFPNAGEVRLALGRGRASLGYTLSRPRVFTPAMAMLLCGAGWLFWQALQAEYFPLPAAARQYERAQAAMAVAAPLRATRLLEQAIALDPSFIAARALLAAGYAELDQPDRAREAVLEAAVAADRRWKLGRVERAGLRAARAAVVRDHKLAAAQYRDLASFTTGRSRTFALVAAGRALEESGDRPAALETLEIAVRNDPESGAARVRLALLLSRNRQHGRALEELQAAESVLEKIGDLEGLSDMLLARWSTRLGSPGEDRLDLERVLALSQRTGNRYHDLSARFRLASMAVQKLDYDGGARMARDAAEQARRAGMPIVAAQALGELGYAFVFKKQPEKAVPILQEAVELAERAKATGVLAVNRMRLGEAFGHLQRYGEALTSMQPAIAWLRESGSRDSLPLFLLKWGGALSGTPRFGEAEAVFREALNRATANGNELYQAMALDRIASFLTPRDPARAAEYWDRALVLARKTRLIRVFALAARNEANLGRFARAEELLNEGQAETDKHPPGADRINFEGLMLSMRAHTAYRRGECADAAAYAREATRRSPTLAREMSTLNCSSDPRAVRLALAWIERDRASWPAVHHAILGSSVSAMYLRLGEAEAAKASAARGLPASEELGLHLPNLENALALRAAERQLGNAAEAERLTARCLDLARKIGFDPSTRFGGRRDLMFLWAAGDEILVRTHLGSIR